MFPFDDVIMAEKSPPYMKSNILCLSHRLYSGRPAFISNKNIICLIKYAHGIVFYLSLIV